MKPKTVLMIILIAIPLASCKIDSAKVQTGFGGTEVDRNGDYLVKDWDKFLELFTVAVTLEDREFLKALSDRAVSCDEPLPDGSMQIWRNTFDKYAVERIDLGLVREMLRENIYTSSYKQGFRRGEIRYFAESENPEHAWMMTFRKSPGGSWKFYSLWYVGEHQNF
jgi:hypothetical protein